jgi:hypothetical protein
MALAPLFTATASLLPEEFGRFQQHIEADWITLALAISAPATLRQRKLPADQVVWLVIGMALYRNLPIIEIVRSLGLVLPDGDGDRDIAPSAIPQARNRLGEAPVRWLFEETGHYWSERSAESTRFCGLSLWGMDGSCLEVADTPDNREHFGGPNSRGGVPSGYPLMRVVVLMALRSHVLRAAAIGGYRQSEIRLAEPLWNEIPDDSLTAVDRGFFGAQMLLGLTRAGRNRHWVTRKKSNLKMRTVRRLGPGDEIVEMTVSPAARKSDPTLPPTWQMRAIRYQKKGFRPQTLLTSLLDVEQFPAAELVAIYHERWELELGYDELKTEMLERKETLRSQAAWAVWQEMWGVLLAYNLVQLERERIAALAGVPPVRISFVTILRELRVAFVMWQHTSPGALPARIRDWREALARFVLPERRSDRSFPRAVKVKMSNYKRKRPRPRPPSTKGVN